MVTIGIHIDHSGCVSNTNLSKRVFDHHLLRGYVSERPRRRNWLSRMMRSRAKDSDVERLNDMMNSAIGNRDNVDFTTD